jgi:type II secretion system protein G
MFRPTCAALLITTLSACSGLQREAQDSLLATLPDRRGVTYDKVRTYPGDVVCGEYTASTVMGYSQRTRPFIYHRGKVWNQPSADEVAVFCTTEPAAALFQRLGIGPMTPDNRALQTVYRDMDTIDRALEASIDRSGEIPSTEAGLAALVDAPEPFLDAVPTDPWGRPYHYERSLGGRVRATFELYTLGSDGEPGGRGDAADIRREHLPFLRRIASVQKAGKTAAD